MMKPSLLLLPYVGIQDTQEGMRLVLLWLDTGSWAEKRTDRIDSDDQSLHIIQFNAEIKFLLLHLLAESLACFEPHSLRGRNFDLFACSGISTFTSSPFPNTESPEAYQSNLVSSRQGA